ncbi:MAG TPA: DNA polymerase IV [Thermomicrobiales bacterium]|nr:DNA polymerase IV [Thermomicrobiales bacterium]
MEVRGRQRWVIHADLDAFFAAAEVLRRPELAGLPVVVGGAPEGRGVVAAASYPARAFGVRSAMPMAEALRLCPDLVIVRGDHHYYRELSHQFRTILDAFSPLVEVVSIDEAYLDASDSDRLFGGAEALAVALKRRVRDEIGLTVSLGVAGNKLVAKIASDLDKPDGLRVVRPGQEAATLAPLPIERLPGVGPKSTARLREGGIQTLGQLAVAPDVLLRAVAGNDAERLRARARGEDDRPVVPAWEREPRKSIGHEETFGRDLRGLPELDAPLYHLSAATGSELRREGLTGTTVTLKLRYSDFTTITRQASLLKASDAHQEIYQLARTLLSRALAERNSPVRLLGVRMTGLASARQLALFDDADERTRKLNAAIDQLAAKGGERLVVPARFAAPRRRPSL